MGDCKECPAPSFPVPPDCAGTSWTLSLWTQRDVGGKRKYGLWKVNRTIEELASELEKEVLAMKQHIFTAAVSWERLRRDIAQLRPGKDLLTYEDFQRNIEVTHFEMPTSMGFSANTIQLALFPIALKFRRVSSTEEIPPVETGAVIFLTTDLRHDHQLVEAMARR